MPYAAVVEPQEFVEHEGSLDQLGNRNTEPDVLQPACLDPN